MKQSGGQLQVSSLLGRVWLEEGRVSLVVFLVTLMLLFFFVVGVIGDSLHWCVFEW